MDLGLGEKLLREYNVWIAFLNDPRKLFEKKVKKKQNKNSFFIFQFYYFPILTRHSFCKDNSYYYFEQRKNRRVSLGYSTLSKKSQFLSFFSSLTKAPERPKASLSSENKEQRFGQPKRLNFDSIEVNLRTTENPEEWIDIPSEVDTDIPSTQPHLNIPDAQPHDYQDEETITWIYEEEDQSSSLTSYSNYADSFNDDLYDGDVDSEFESLVGNSQVPSESSSYYEDDDKEVCILLFT